MREMRRLAKGAEACFVCNWKDSGDLPSPIGLAFERLSGR